MVTKIPQLIDIQFGATYEPEKARRLVEEIRRIAFALNAVIQEVTNANTGAGASEHELASTTGLGPDHTVTGLTSGQVLKAITDSQARFDRLEFAELAQVDPATFTGVAQGDLLQFWDGFFSMRPLSSIGFGTGDPLVLLGNPLNAAGTIEGIPATANDTVMRRVGDTLSFGQLTAQMAPDGLWTYSKLQLASPKTLLGGGTSGPGSVREIAIGSGLNFDGSSLSALMMGARDGEDGADGISIRGSDGAAGSNGLTIRGQDGEDGSDSYIPGPPGQSITGANGFTMRGDDGEDGRDGVFLRGTDGRDGVDGRDGSFIRGDDGEDGANSNVPGPPGLAGATGADGRDGLSIRGMDGEDGQDGMSIPGGQGPQGPTGAAGNDGLSIRGMDGEDGADGVPIPGQPGAQGAAGAAGADGLSIRGQDGEDGNDGLTIRGQDGVTGAAGLTIPGRDGEDGDNGFTIPPRDGIDGINGFTIRGADGDDGQDSYIPGPTGPAGAAGSSSAGQSGTVLFDFGAFPGSTHATVVVTGQTNIVAGSKVRVSLDYKASADHSADEHFLEPIMVGASTIVAGTGFTAEAHYVGVHPQDNTPGLRRPQQRNDNTPMAFGKFNGLWQGDYA